jgi:hypothetical protein
MLRPQTQDLHQSMRIAAAQVLAVAAGAAEATLLYACTCKPLPTQIGSNESKVAFGHI